MDTDTPALNQVKESAWQQQLILMDALDLQIVRELKQLMQTVMISQIDSHLDLVDSILQLNCSSPKFDVTWMLADAKKDYWTLTDGLLKCYG